jgi:hypothetical protein
VSVHGVNYTADEFSYLLIDPDQPDSSSAGEHIDPFAAGGTTCCYVLPKQWKPGIKVKIQTIHWLPEDRDGNLPEVKEEHVVDVPAYVDGKPGELWVLRQSDGSVGLVSSDYQPDHDKWPGKVKGWPIPSLEYRRERWELVREYQASGVKLYIGLLDELEKKPELRAQEAWEFSQKYDRESIKGFSGPADPKYREDLRRSYAESLQRSKQLLDEVMKAKP